MTSDVTRVVLSNTGATQSLCVCFFSFFFFPVDLGVDNPSVIANSSFTASAGYACQSPPSYATSPPDGKCHSAWCGNAPHALNWLQIRFNVLNYVSHLSTKGSKLGYIVTSFYLTYSVDGVTWENYTLDGERQVGNFISFHADAMLCHAML